MRGTGNEGVREETESDPGRKEEMDLQGATLA